MTSHNAPSLRILYVEDNDIVREQTKELLSAPDRDIVTCESAEQALIELENAAFHVTITDISLPKMSGIDLAKRIRQINPEAWIVIMSGYALPQVGALGSNTRILPKPIDTDHIDALLQDIRRVL